MTPADIERMAREAESPAWGDWFSDEDALMRFAALVAAAERGRAIDIVAMYGGSVEIEAAIRAEGDQ